MREKFLSDEFIPEEEADEIVEVVEDEFPLENWWLYRKKVELTFELSGDVETKFRRVMRKLKGKGYLPSLIEEDGKGLMEVRKTIK